MKIGFYPRLAADGIRKNGRMYLPYFLTCIGMVAMTYILNFLKASETVQTLKGSNIIQIFMNFGGYVVVAFSAVFLFYTHSFLIRRRKKEFGLYNILGMNKKDIGKILFWESLFTALVSIAAGLIVGIACSKLSELGLINILQEEVNYHLSISPESLEKTVKPFGIIFFLLFLDSLRQVWFSKAIRLLRSENIGEKPPKANWFLGIFGCILLGIAYGLAVTIKEPVSAIGRFFVAVLLVIAATYLLMIAGSVLLCRILQSRKSYYYHPDHFVSVSSMSYRMKRNGAGLASICILATMVLVMVSSTSALVIGMEDVLRQDYPREINLQCYEENGRRHLSHENIGSVEEIVSQCLEAFGAAPENLIRYQRISATVLLNNGRFLYDKDSVSDFNLGTYSDVIEVYIFSLSHYNAVTGQNLELSEDETLVYSSRTDFREETIGFAGGKTYRVEAYLPKGFVTDEATISVLPQFQMIVNDPEEALQGTEGIPWYRVSCVNFDVPFGKAQEEQFVQDLRGAFRDAELSGNYPFHTRISDREENRKNYLSLYGGLFYLGILLSAVFLVAAVLIIYYKQIAEGYEDQQRFSIMQKVGMTKRDIRRSINAQLRVVFFLPLFAAGMHLLFAFPMIEKCLLMFHLNNRWLFLKTTAASFLAFALFYVVVYRLTSNAYYQIVSGSRET